MSSSVETSPVKDASVMGGYDLLMDTPRHVSRVLDMDFSQWNHRQLHSYTPLMHETHTDDQDDSVCTAEDAEAASRDTLNALVTHEMCHDPLSKVGSGKVITHLSTVTSSEITEHGVVDNVTQVTTVIHRVLRTHVTCDKWRKGWSHRLQNGRFVPYAPSKNTAILQPSMSGITSKTTVRYIDAPDDSL
jgi:hypothetical protein